jgi:hypothetical protein
MSKLLKQKFQKQFQKKQAYTTYKTNNMSDDYGYILDMVQRKSCVDAAMEVWKEKRQSEWAEKDANWEKEYDARIVEEERKAKEEQERFDNMTEEEKEARMNAWDMFAEDWDDSSDDEDDSVIELEDDDLPCWEDDSNLTPEEKKAREWEDYKKQVKEWREKRTNEIWDTMLYCSWRQLRAYRTQLGMSNENFDWCE